MRRGILWMTVWAAGCVSGSGTGTDGGAAGDAAVHRDAGDDNQDAGCLGFSEASAACGFNSDGSVCLMAVTCGLATSDMACRNACETGTRTHCYSRNDMTCLAAAALTQVCADLSACGVAL